VAKVNVTNIITCEVCNVSWDLDAEPPACDESYHRKTLTVTADPGTVNSDKPFDRADVMYAWPMVVKKMFLGEYDHPQIQAPPVG
jgi:hypothetical protein